MKSFLFENLCFAFLQQWFIIYLHKITSQQCSRPKIMWEVVVLEVHRKLTCGSSFCNDGDWKTQISMELGYTRELYLKSLGGQSCKIQLFKVTNKENPRRMFSLACNLLKMDACFSDFEKMFLAKNPCDCNQMRSNQIAANTNALNHFHF